MIRLILCDVGRMSTESTMNIYKKTPLFRGVVPSSDGRGFYDSARAYIALIRVVARLCSSLEKVDICYESSISDAGADGEKIENPGSESSSDKPSKDRFGTASRDAVSDSPEGDITHGGIIDFSLRRGEFGKPEFEHLNISFSISHRGDDVAILLSDEGEVGVDLECLIDEKRAVGIESRFLREIYPEGGEIHNIELVSAALSADGEKIEIEKMGCDSIPKNPTDFTKWRENDNYNLHIWQISPSFDITSRWTALEAVMKLTGKGFADFPRAAEIIGASRVISFCAVRREREYRISVALPRIK